MTFQLSTVLLFLLGAGGVFVFLYIRQRVRDVSKAMFGTEDIAQGLRRQREELAVTPKSVSGMTKVFLPQIQRDFPEFNWAEFRQKSENWLRSSLLAVSALDMGRLCEASEDLKRQISLRIEDLKGQGLREVYEQITVYRTEITGYRKDSGTCVITLQSAVGHLHYTLEDENVKKGSREYAEQTKYNMELQYVQDASKANALGTGLGITCPQCGAPVTRLGSKFCEYCGAGVVVINIHAWALNKIYEVYGGKG